MSHLTIALEKTQDKNTFILAATLPFWEITLMQSLNRDRMLSVTDCNGMAEVPATVFKGGHRLAGLCVGVSAK